MGVVIPLGNVTRLDLPPERILSAVPKLAGVLIMGYDEDGAEYFASSYADGGTALWLMERCKKRLLMDDE